MFYFRFFFLVFFILYVSFRIFYFYLTWKFFNVSKYNDDL